MPVASFHMIEDRLVIEAVETLEGGSDFAADARIRHKSEFPGRSARRMTHLGMLITLCLQKMNADKDIPIIYASAFGESESLEKFIDSFPEASPALFQSSIHPSAVEQGLISKKQAVNRFYPITSDLNLFGQAIENCFLLGEQDVILLGGDEKGNWLCPYRLASAVSFAFGMRLTREGDGIGSLKIDRTQRPDRDECIGLQQASDSIRNRNNLSIPSFALDGWIRLEWK